MNHHRVSEHNSNDSEANTDSAGMPQPDITRTVEEIVDLYGTYASGAGQGIYTKSITKDEAVQKLVTLVQEARKDELNKLVMLGQGSDLIQTRIKELSQ